MTIADSRNPRADDKLIVARLRLRRGTIMVFVLGVLTLLALIGLILIARTHGEAKRLSNETAAVSSQGVADGVVHSVQNLLRKDIWGSAPSATATTVEMPLSGDSTGTNKLTETNEPYDAPGPEDPWLASTTPYDVGDVTVNDPIDPQPEYDVLAWHRVSYIGSDVTRNSTKRPFLWRFNARTGDPFTIGATYGDASLQGVEIRQTPPPGFTDPLVPGSTTNVTISVARRLWEADPPITPIGIVPQFPYFDTNADGELDLYDADGDGVPDSPLSLVIPVSTSDPNAHRQLYAAVRIVDHSSMLNLNVASSLMLPGGGPTDLTYDDTKPDFQRRGRRVTELLLDDVLHPDDALVRASQMVNERSGADPVAYDGDIVKRWLAGTHAITPGYAPFGLSEEASLRHRGMLVPHGRKQLRTPPVGQQWNTIDAALPGTLLWSAALVTDSSSYDQAVSPRWARFNSDYTSAAYEGDDISNEQRGWRSLLREDEPFGVRRHMLTTLSYAVRPPPRGLTLDKATENYVTDFASTNPVRIPPSTNPADDVYMGWPVLNKTIYAGSPVLAFPEVPSWARVQRIDLNMGDPAATAPEEIAAIKQVFTRYVAAAMYKALQGADNYQCFRLTDDATTPQNEKTRNLEYLAWQFAANLVDYRDSDGEPTVIQWLYDGTNSQYVYGVEKQPFLTEAYAALVTGDSPDDGGLQGQNLPTTTDKWFHAVELFVPPGWKVSTAELYINSVGAKARMPSGQLVDIGPIALSQFRNGSSPMPAYLDGGAVNGTGQYYVLCGPITTVTSQFGIAADTFYTNANFKMATDGTANVQLIWAPAGTTAPIWNDMRTHVIDGIGGDTSGRRLNGNQSSLGGLGKFGLRDVTWPTGTTRQYSLLRSTKGWRFTTAWHQYGEGGLLGQNMPGLRPVYRSLGRANTTTAGTSHTGSPYGELDNRVPESVWPAMFSPGTGDSQPLFPHPVDGPKPGLTSGHPFEAFDSVTELGRMLMVGPVRRAIANVPPYCSPPSFPGSTIRYETDAHVPATVRLAKLLMTQGRGDLPSLATPQEGTYVGRVDFFNALKGVDGKPWTWRLADYFTVDSPAYDGIDNDMNGFIDDDPAEGVALLNRSVGKININTAPLPVLRSIPFMSFLPTSFIYAHFMNAGSPVANPALEFDTAVANDIPLFWDIGAAIVSLREARPVALRLPDDLGGMLTVARAKPKTTGDLGGISGGSGSSGGTPAKAEPVIFSSVGALTQLDGKVVADTSAGGMDDTFHLGRFWSRRQRFLMLAHGDDAISPDYRYRSDVDVYDNVSLNAGGTTNNNGGIRARDILLARIANMLTTRSDVFTAYIVLIDEDGNYVRRTQVTLDRSVCFKENRDPSDPNRRPILPDVLLRDDGSYSDDRN